MDLDCRAGFVGGASEWTDSAAKARALSAESCSGVCCMM